jgi:hypothetical protein
MQKAEGAAVNMDKDFENFEKSLIENFFGGKSLNLPLCLSSNKNLLRL